MLTPDDRARLSTVLERARGRGGLGPAPVTSHIDHAVSMARCLEWVPRRVLDLGSGAGVPGLVHALIWPHAQVSLLDANRRRAEALRIAVAELELGDRCEIIHERAEVAAHHREHRGHYDLVTARSFGSPPVTAECAAGFLALGGELLVSEPPTPGADRWPSTELAALGFDPPVPCAAPGVSAARLRRSGAVPVETPRRTGIPKKRPLW